MILILKTLGSQKGSPVAAEEGAKGRGGGRGRGGERRRVCEDYRASTICFIQVVRSPPSWSRRVTQIMSAEALLLNGFG